MNYEKFANPEGVELIKVTTPEGRVFIFADLATKPLDAKLKMEGKVRFRNFRAGFNAACKKAQQAGVPLSAIIPVS